MENYINTVTGKISPSELGVTLTHEHILCDLTCKCDTPEGVTQKSIAQEPVGLENLWWVRKHPLEHIDNNILDDLAMMEKELKQFTLQGGQSIVEATSRGMQRDPLGLKQIALESDLNIIAGSGFYVERCSRQKNQINDEKPTNELKQEILEEVNNGIGSTDIKPGLIGEIGLETQPLSAVEKKYLKASARAQRETGLPLALHIYPHPLDEVDEIIDIAEREGANLNKIILCHLDSTHRKLKSVEKLLELGKRGCYLEFDQWGYDKSWLSIEGNSIPSNLDRIKSLRKLIDKGMLKKILLSHDVCSKCQLTSFGGFGYAHLLRDVKPIMKNNGIEEETINTMLAKNPRDVLTIH